MNRIPTMVRTCFPLIAPPVSWRWPSWARPAIGADLQSGKVPREPGIHGAGLPVVAHREALQRVRHHGVAEPGGVEPLQGPVARAVQDRAAPVRLLEVRIAQDQHPARVIDTMVHLHVRRVYEVDEILEAVPRPMRELHRGADVTDGLDERHPE